MANVTKELKDRLGRIAEDAGDNLDRAGEVISAKIYEVARLLHGHTVISYDDGKAVQEVLNRYKDELAKEAFSLSAIGEETYQTDKDIEYVTGLAKLFD